MKFTIINIFLGLVFISCSAQKQEDNFKITYKKEISSFIDGKRGDALKKKDPERYEKYRAIQKKRNEAAKRLNYQLFISKQRALFEVEDILKKDGIGSLGLGPLKGTYYTNLKTKENFWQTDVFGKTYLVTFKDRDWELKEGTKTVNGHTCKKAIYHHKVETRNGIRKFPVEVWYAPDLPLNFGPLGYNGLPGLILELSIQGERYYATKIKPVKNVSIEKPEKGEKITFDGLNAMAKGAMQNAKPN